ncbi:MAG TPA: amino acid ABC transporter permease [Herpetosiphonaceae bacterium]
MTSEHWSLIGQGVATTLWITVAAAGISLALGIVIAVLRLAPLGPLSWLAGSYTEFFRNIPLLTVIFFMYFGLPNSGLKLKIEPINVAIWGMGLYTAAYAAEVIRAGLGTVSKGNVEAARSLGLSYLQSMRYVQLPQALRATIPPLGTLLTALLKNTSLANIISAGELLQQAEIVYSRTFNLTSMLIAAAIYVALTLPIGALANLAEQRWAIKR